MTDAAFCAFCANPVTDVAPPPSPGKKPVSGLDRFIRLIGVLLLVGLTAVGYNFYKGNEQFKTAVDRVPDVMLAAASMRTSQQVSLLSQPAQVPPLRYLYYKVTVEPRWFNARITGSLRAAGGSGNDIEMTIRSEPDGGQVFYASGRVTQSQVDVPLRQGIYYVQFSNAFSLLSSKTVSGDLALKYEY